MQVEAVILAAGTSSRMPPWKLGLPLGPRTVVEWTVETFSRVAHRVIVVGGHRFEDLRRLLAPYAVDLVYNERHPEGMFSSVKAGLHQVNLDADWVFIHPADHPLVRPRTLQLLLESRGAVVVPTYRGRKGHPLLLRGSLVPAVLAWPDHETLRTFVRSSPLTLVETGDPAVVLDLDHPEDYERLKQLAEERLEGL